MVDHVIEGNIIYIYSLIRNPEEIPFATADFCDRKMSLPRLASVISGNVAAAAEGGKLYVLEKWPRIY